MLPAGFLHLAHSLGSHSSQVELGGADEQMVCNIVCQGAIMCTHMSYIQVHNWVCNRFARSVVTLSHGARTVQLIPSLHLQFVQTASVACVLRAALRASLKPLEADWAVKYLVEACSTVS